jgi:hypothetical protein
MSAATDNTPTDPSGPLAVERSGSVVVALRHGPSGVWQTAYPMA